MARLTLVESLHWLTLGCGTFEGFPGHLGDKTSNPFRSC